MATNRITVRRNDDKITVTSNDIHVKEAIWGWGSWGTGSGKREFPEYYGRSLEVGKHAFPDRELWQWDLTEELAQHLTAVMPTNPGETPEEIKASHDVVRELTSCLEGTQEKLDEFTEAYIVAALWSTTDQSDEAGGDPLEDNYGVGDISSEAMKNIKEDCAKFQAENAELLAEAYEKYVTRDGYSGAALAGHDFWLTRGGHGAGFFDRGLGEVGKKLTEAAHKFGECWIEVGDDGQLHGF